MLSSGISHETMQKPQLHTPGRAVLLQALQADGAGTGPKVQERLGLPADTADSLMKKMPLQGPKLEVKNRILEVPTIFLRPKKRAM